MNRILLDQGLAPLAASLLREHGIDAVHVIEIGMDRADDLQILERARNDDRVCVTLDHDFHAHLAVTGQGRPSVVRLRIQLTANPSVSDDSRSKATDRRLDPTSRRHQMPS